jgi:hypothetical protein
LDLGVERTFGGEPKSTLGRKRKETVGFLYIIDLLMSTFLALDVLI